jgi:hypothetical protein
MNSPIFLRCLPLGVRRPGQPPASRDIHRVPAALPRHRSLESRQGCGKPLMKRSSIPGIR